MRFVKLSQLAPATQPVILCAFSGTPVDVLTSGNQFVRVVCLVNGKLDILPRHKAVSLRAHIIFVLDQAWHDDPAMMMMSIREGSTTPAPTYRILVKVLEYLLSYWDRAPELKMIFMDIVDVPHQKYDAPPANDAAADIDDILHAAEAQPYARVAEEGATLAQFRSLNHCDNPIYIDRVALNAGDMATNMVVPESAARPSTVATMGCNVTAALQKTKVEIAAAVTSTMHPAYVSYAPEQKVKFMKQIAAVIATQLGPPDREIDFGEKKIATTVSIGVDWNDIEQVRVYKHNNYMANRDKYLAAGHARYHGPKHDDIVKWQREYNADHKEERATNQQNYIERQEQKAADGLIHCDVCQLDFQDDNTLTVHKKGGVHLRMVELQDEHKVAVAGVDFVKMTCKLCPYGPATDSKHGTTGKITPARTFWNRHVTGEPHRAALTAAKRQTKLSFSTRK